MVTAKGFKRYEENSVIVPSAERVVLNRIELQVGEMTQTIEVQAETARLQTQSAERGGLISLDQTQDVPLKGRALLKLLPGIIDTYATSSRIRYAPCFEVFSHARRY